MISLKLSLMSPLISFLIFWKIALMKQMRQRFRIRPIDCLHPYFERKACEPKQGKLFVVK